MQLDSYMIWAVALFGYGFNRLAEWRIHSINYRILMDYKAEELMPKLMRRYYLAIFFFIPLSGIEAWYSGAVMDRGWTLAGITLVIAGFVLRCWAIRSLGRLWSMRCLGLVGGPLVRKGAYKYFANPEYLSRAMDGVGLCLIIGAQLTALSYLIVIFYMGWRICTVEKRQLMELAVEIPRIEKHGFR